MRFRLPSLAAFALAGCFPFDFDPPKIDTHRFSCSGPERSFDGVWTIRGSGSRDECEESRLDTDLFEIRAQRLVFETVDGHFFLDREASGVSEDFDVLESEVRGRCATFTTLESTRWGPVRIEWQAAGTADPDVVQGELSGDGPGSCRLRGSFRARIEPEL